MKRKWLDRKPGAKGLTRTKGLSTTRTVRRDRGQRAVPTLAAATSAFNQAVIGRWREKWGLLCAKCGEGEGPTADYKIEVSHFFNVRWSGTRFSYWNVDPLHRRCHTGQSGWEYQKHKGGEYYKYMLMKLGPGGLDLLSRRAHSPMKLEAAKAELVEKLEGGTLWSS